MLKITQEKRDRNTYKTERDCSVGPSPVGSLAYAFSCNVRLKLFHLGGREGEQQVSCRVGILSSIHRYCMYSLLSN